MDLRYGNQGRKRYLIHAYVPNRETLPLSMLNLDGTLEFNFVQ